MNRSSSSSGCCSVVELRQYTLHPGGRDVLIELFDRELVETQEAVGMHVIGQFRDLDAPGRFVWLRGFPDMVARGRSLADFYGGPVWAEHRSAANATMIDSDDVLLLRPASPGGGFVHPPPSRDQNTDRPAGTLVATVYHQAGPDDRFAEFLKSKITPVLVEAGATSLATFVTEPAENTFPDLPVRTGEHVAVSFTRFDSPNEHRIYLERLAESTAWAHVVDELTARSVGSPTTIRLEPTARSQLR